MNLSYGKTDGGRLVLYNPQTMERTERPGKDGILISASDSHIYTIPTQLSSDEQIKAFITQYIRSIHPGPYESLKTDYYLSGSGKQRVIVLCIMEEEILNLYLEKSKPLFYFFQLTKRPGVYYFKSLQDLEVYEIDKERFDSYESQIIPENGTDMSEIPFQLKPFGPYRRSAFSPRKEKKLLPLVTLTLLLGIVLLSGIDLISLINENRTLDESIHAAREHHMKLNASLKENKESGDSLKLSLDFAALAESIPVNNYKILEAMADRVNRRVLISNLVMTQDRIDIKGETDNTLKLIAELYQSDLFLEITPSNIQPGENGKEQFSLTGVLK